MCETQLSLSELFSQESLFSDSHGEVAPITPDIQAPEYPMSLDSRIDDSEEADIEAALAFDNYSEGSRTPGVGVQTPAPLLQTAPSTPHMPNGAIRDGQPMKRLRTHDVQLAGGQDSTGLQNTTGVQNTPMVQNTSNFRLFMTKVGTGVPELPRSASEMSSLTSYGPFLKECGLYNEAAMRTGAPGVPSPMERATPQQGQCVPLVVLKAHLSEVYEGHVTMSLPNAVLLKFQSLPPVVRDTICRMAMISGKNWFALGCAISS